MANFGDTTVVDNSNLFTQLGEFKKAMLTPIYEQLTGQRKEWVKRTLCRFTDEENKVFSGYLTDVEMRENPQYVAYVPTGSLVAPSIEGMENVRDKDAVRICNDKGANFVVFELGKFFNDKMLFANITVDEAADMAYDPITRVFCHMIANYHDFGVADLNELIISGSNFSASLYGFLSGLTDGENRTAIIQILTGGGYQVTRDETSPKADDMLRNIKVGGK